MTQASEKTWDVIVIGGGPSGMMAAATAADAGATVLLLEKNTILGKKLRITGGGRCNITNNKPDPRSMLTMYKGKGKFLHSTFAVHGVRESVTWFRERGVELKEENEGRLFPVTESAEHVCETMISELKRTTVCIESNAPVSAVVKKDNSFSVQTPNKTYTAHRCIIATGGVSRPETGSTGDGFTWAKKLGHTINDHSVALVPLLAKEPWLKDISGVSLTDVKLRVLVDGKQEYKERGKILFTHVGVSGPTILNMSKRISELLQAGTVTIEIGILPSKDEGEIRAMLTELFHSNSNQTVRNALKEFVPTSVAKILLRIAGVDADTPCHSVRVEEKKQLAKLLFSLPITITGLMGKDKAVISAGGVHLPEVDFKTMESKIIADLYLVGDVLDVDRPSGGYSLQLCWSTGYVAGLNAARKN